ncbi:MAG: SurA N-terminal domain-containing protein [Bacteroidales bacterium]|jgi:peptidyl-prolyl cis-trans isomerase D|nr:SurA N-terminal domain-containing protein [Bacteroidales bacterium]
MAVLETIRNKGGVIVSVVIGAALVAFILGDFIPRNGSRNSDVAEVGKKKLTYQDYEQRIAEMTNRYQQSTGQSSLDERMMDMVREQAWQFMISGVVAEQEYEKIGLTVSPEELFDLVQGANPDPMIRQIPDFTDPQTGAFSRSRLMEFLKNKNLYPDAARQWVILEKELMNNRYAQKYDNLVSRGIYAPGFMVNNENLEVNKKVDFDFMVKQYSSVPDSAVKVNNTDLKKYYDENKGQWQQDASRDIEYVVFNIVPSDEDRAAADQWIEKIKPDFEKAENPQQFVNLNSHVPFDSKFYTQEQLPVQVTSIFNADMEEVIGPYQEGEALKLARLAKIENRPDSVKVRQIVIMPKQQTQEAAMEAVNLADSIKNAIEGGANFTTLALKYSSDPSVSATNGDIGWIHEIDVQAGSMADQLFSMKKGEVTKMESPQGLFIAQVTERGKEVKKVQVAILQYNILPSPRTEQLLYAQASKFAIENRTEAKFDEASQQLSKRVATYLGENDRQIPGLSSGRQIIRWAYEAKKGTVSDVFTLDDAYVVAVLKNIRKEGIAPFEQVVAEITVTVQKQKKAQQISATLSDAAKNAQSFSEMALGLGIPVESASEITFSSFSVPSAGIEPKLIAAATTLPEGNISQPVEGANGVYLVTVKQITEPEEGMVGEAKNRLLSTYRNRSASESLQALRKAANIKDMRSKFY